MPKVRNIAEFGESSVPSVCVAVVGPSFMLDL